MRSLNPLSTLHALAVFYPFCVDQMGNSPEFGSFDGRGDNRLLPSPLELEIHLMMMRYLHLYKFLTFHTINCRLLLCINNFLILMSGIDHRTLDA